MTSVKTVGFRSRWNPMVSPQMKQQLKDETLGPTLKSGSVCSQHPGLQLPSSALCRCQKTVAHLKPYRSECLHGRKASEDGQLKQNNKVNYLQRCFPAAKRDGRKKCPVCSVQPDAIPLAALFLRSGTFLLSRNSMLFCTSRDRRTTPEPILVFTAAGWRYL